MAHSILRPAILKGVKKIAIFLFQSRLTKGPLISKCSFGLPKNQRKIFKDFCPSLDLETRWPNVMQAYGYACLRLYLPTLMHAYGYAHLKLYAPTVMHVYSYAHIWFCTHMVMQA